MKCLMQKFMHTNFYAYIHGLKQRLLIFLNYWWWCNVTENITIFLEKKGLDRMREFLWRFVPWEKVSAEIHGSSSLVSVQRRPRPVVGSDFYLVEKFSFSRINSRVLCMHFGFRHGDYVTIKQDSSHALQKICRIWMQHLVGITIVISIKICGMEIKLKLF